MANKSKVKGTRFETDLVDVINDWEGLAICERLPLHGNEDRGDIRLRIRDLTICIEAKNLKDYPPPSLMEKFRDDTVTETANLGADGGLLIISKYRKRITLSEVWMQHGTFFKLYHREPPEMDDAHAWCCMTLGDFLRRFLGEPAWADRREH